ncbi:hypothetical protein ACP4OV_022986 [Aristida adscensionis]
MTAAVCSRNTSLLAFLVLVGVVLQLCSLVPPAAAAAAAGSRELPGDQQPSSVGEGGTKLGGMMDSAVLAAAAARAVASNHADVVGRRLQYLSGTKGSPGMEGQSGS